MRKGILISVLVLSLVLVAGVALAAWSGYNYKARIFVGTGLQWCEQGRPDWPGCVDYLGPYANDLLIMKWNAEWDRGNDEGWSNPPYDAWEDNEWNGKIPGGSGAVWHYKIKWVGDCVSDQSLLPDGSYCIWGQFAVIMDQGVDPYYGPGHMGSPRLSHWVRELNVRLARSFIYEVKPRKIGLDCFVFNKIKY
ncbi:MAG: hypothetical protein ACOZAL_03765 [Patescibacteria group bacterium]